MITGEGGGALQKAIVEKNLRVLNREYELMYHRKGDIDERQFLTSDAIGIIWHISLFLVHCFIDRFFFI
jgi:hypothetical protein